MKGNSELPERIKQIKEEREAIILAHNYQLGEVQDIADFVGDSLELSRRAANTDAKVIVFCGVDFMAETSSILSPEKTVLLPNLEARCPMAAMITPESLRKKKEEHPGATVVCYVNSSAAVKAESDICCTSANAVKVVQKLGDNDILFVPDQYLGQYVSSKTGKEMILWPGFCPTHIRITREHILRLKDEHPDAKVVTHPECRPEVIEVADEVQSTGGMCRFAKETDVKEIIVGTEIGIIHRLRKEAPDKKFIPASEQAVCPRMKLTTLENILWSLEELSPQVGVPEETRLKARNAVNRMVEIA